MQHDSRLRPGSVRPGGRTARTRELVLDAVMAELTEHGYAGTGIEKIAKRAGVAPSTVYRRWRTLEELVIDTSTKMASDNIVLPDTGTLVGDLTALARSIVHLYEVPLHKAWIDVMVSSAARDKAAREALSGILAARLDATAVLVERAVARGEIPPVNDAREVIRMMAAPIYYRMYITGEEVDVAVADRAATAAVLAAREGLL